MSCLQFTACWPDINVAQSHRLTSLSHTLPTSAKFIYRAPSKPTTMVSKYQPSMPVCASGGKEKSENNNEASPWKGLEKAIGSFKKEPSIEEVLKQQMENQEFYDGGHGGIPPNQGGDGSGGSEDEDSWDESIQVTLAAIGFIFSYIYILHGEEMVRLAKDYIKYLLWGRQSARLRQAMYVWERFRKKMTEKKVEDKYWLEKAILNTRTWYDSPEKYQRILQPQPQPQKRQQEQEEEESSSEWEGF